MTATLPSKQRRPRTLGACLVATAALWASGALHAQETGPQYDAPTTAEAVQKAQSPVEPAKLRFDIISGDIEHRIDRLMAEMTLAEKIGQLVQVYPPEDQLTEELANKIRAGQIGSIFYPGNAHVVKQAQQIATDESRLGIPLLVARDVVHGFHTAFPIPLGQAASWNPELVEIAAKHSAHEAVAEGIHWTFAPMVDICRDARWGRIAETVGEDPRLAGDLAAAMVRGFQQRENGKVHGVIACAKHFVGYGLSEGGRDYNRVSVSQTDLHNVLLPPFRASIDAGCGSLMTTFSEVNGVPGTAHNHLLGDVLRRDWGFCGVVVSDWGSVTEMIEHGFAKDEADAARRAMLATVDMDMCSPAYATQLEKLVTSGQIPLEALDDAVRRVIRSKADLSPHAVKLAADAAEGNRVTHAARQLARQSVVLLKNNQVLPLDQESLGRVAVIGPLADAAKQQLGCWSLDAQVERSITPLADLRERLAGQAEVSYARGAVNSFSEDDSLIAEAVQAAADADVALLFLGEDATLSGEARCRADLSLPGVQTKLFNEVVKTGTPTVVVILSGRPLTIGNLCESADAVLFAWHPGSMAGPAIDDLLLGVAAPSGKLPVTFPKTVGQVPLYYNHSNTGRPSPADYKPLLETDREDLPAEFQYRSHYLDVDDKPLFPFGFGLSYTEFSYTDLELSSPAIRPTDVLAVRVKLTNTGSRAASEVSQLYFRDPTASVVRPVRELLAYRRTHLKPGQSTVLEFAVPASELGYYTSDGRYVLEPGDFKVWVGGDSTAELGGQFELLPKAGETDIRPFAISRGGSRSGGRWDRSDR